MARSPPRSAARTLSSRRRRNSSVPAREVDRRRLRGLEVRAAAIAALRRATSAPSPAKARARVSRSAPLSVGSSSIKHVAGLDAAAVLDVDGHDLAGIERLHDLGLAARLDLSGGDRVDVEPAEIRPGERTGDGEADIEEERYADRRWRRLQDLDRGGQELLIPGIGSERLSRSSRARWPLRLRSSLTPRCLRPGGARAWRKARPGARASSACVPCSLTAPLSSATMRSHRRTADSRCAMMITVRPCAIWRILAWTMRSLS